MRLSREDVIWAYRMILGREPESDAVIQDHLVLGNLATLRLNMLNSEEFNASRPSSGGAYSGYTVEDVRLLEKYKVESGSNEGFVTDFLGSKTDIRFNKATENLSGLVEGLPVPACFHAETIEWAGLLRSVEDADRSYTAVELGAGWGPWIVAGALAAKAKGISDIKIAGVEADEQHFQFMREHIANNGVEACVASLLQGAVQAVDGVARFPIIDSVSDWGAAAIDGSQGGAPETDYRGQKLQFKEVKAYSIPTILERFSFVDLVHVDIQGSEAVVIPEAIETLSGKVLRVIVGTHSRKIEGDLFSVFSANGWVLEREKPCLFRSPDDGLITEAHTYMDGTQVWLNPKLK